VEVDLVPKRKRRSAEFKFKVALEAAKSTKTLSELSSEYEVHSTQIRILLGKPVHINI
jgi:transposase-like protein